MADTLTACPRDESVLSGLASQSQADGGFSPLQVLAEAGGFRLLRGAVLLHGGAIAVAFVAPHTLHTLAILVTGLVVLMLALSLPQVAGRISISSSDSVAAAPAADLSPAGRGAAPEPETASAPAPLPFMGERIVLNTSAGGLPALARAAARLRHSSSSARVHPWGDLIARVSHELRTPLNAVIGFSDVMQAELLGPVGHPRYREYARHIRDSGRELLKSAEDTLAITCLLDHNPEATIEVTPDLAALVEECWAFHADPTLDHGLRLEADVPEGLEVLVDRRPMRQILINLFAEALRRADSRGTVGLVASVNGDLVQVEVFLRGKPDSTAVGQASLPICLARALLEVHGAALIELDDPHSTWRALTVLRCSAQDDFFRVPHSWDGAAEGAQAALC